MVFPVCVGERCAPLAAVHRMEEGRVTPVGRPGPGGPGHSLAAVGELVQGAEVEVEIGVHGDGPAELRS
ncbi:hypothetical protein ACWDRS_34930, partial [Streptomyces griseus]